MIKCLVSNCSRSEESSKAKPSDEKLWLYALWSFGLLVLLTVAIMTPSFLNYRYRVLQLEQLYPSTNAVPASKPETLGSSNSAPAIVGASIKSNKSELGDQPLKTSDIYETYGQLVTMLLGFVAAVGVLCGYFAKKSIRELTEDVRFDMDREKERIKTELEFAIKRVEEVGRSAKSSLENADALRKELNALTGKAEKVLDALEEATAKYKYNDPPRTPPTAKTTAAVDEELAKDLS